MITSTKKVIITITRVEVIAKEAKTSVVPMLATRKRAAKPAVAHSQVRSQAASAVAMASASKKKVPIS